MEKTQGEIATDETGEAPKLLQEASWESYVAGPEAQEAFAQGGEAGYLVYVYEEARRRIEQGRAQPTTTVVIGRHEVGSEWPDYANLKSAEPELKDETAAPAPDSVGSEASTSPPADVAQAATAEEVEKSEASEPDNIPAPAGQGNAILLPPAVQNVATGQANQPPGVTEEGQAKAELEKLEQDTRFHELQRTYAEVLARNRRDGIAQYAGRLSIGALLSLLDKRTANKQSQELERARTAYEQALQQRLEQMPGMIRPYVASQLAGAFRNQTLDVQARQAGVAIALSGHRNFPQSNDRLFAEKWRRSSDRERDLIIGRIPLVAGLVFGGAAGVLVGLVAPPLAATIGAVGATGGLAALFGRVWGGRVSKRVNRSEIMTPEGYENEKTVNDQRIGDMGQYFIAGLGRRPAIENDVFAITKEFEVHTATEVERERRLVRAKRVGAGAALFAALVGFAGGEAVDFMIRSGQAINERGSSSEQARATPTPHPTVTPKGTPGSGAGGGSGPGSGGGNIPSSLQPASLRTEYPYDAAMQWNAAHNVPTDPNHVWQTLQHWAADANDVPGQAHQYHYVLQPNGKTWLMDGTRALSSIEQGAFNVSSWTAHP